MKITIKQTLIYLSGMFSGQQTERFITVYNERDKLKYMSQPYRYGSEVKLLKTEIL